MMTNTILIIASVVGLVVLVLVIKSHFAKQELIHKQSKMKKNTNQGKEFSIPFKPAEPIEEEKILVDREPLDMEEPIITKRPMKVKLPYDANNIQNLTKYNKGTYRHESGRFKSLKAV
tara:strand:- start:285 stop:638 length:354 start_codon:yes stop_codon:yes gene_type:complete